MSWSPIELPPSKLKGMPPRAGVYVSTTKPGRYACTMLMGFRPSAFDPAPKWLADGQGVEVLVGHGEHAGRLRIQPGTRLRLMRATGARPGKPGGTGNLCLRLPLLPGVPEAKRAGTSCEFDYHDDWIEVELPAWARPKAEATPPSATPAPPKPAATQPAPQAGRRLLTDAVLSHPEWGSKRGAEAHRVATGGGA